MSSVGTMLFNINLHVYLQLLYMYINCSSFSNSLGCDMRNEISVIKNFIQKEFIVKKRSPEYDPENFRLMCISAGAPALFDTILSAITSPRHSVERINLNKKRTMYMIYKLCYCLSQQCNMLQVDHGLYFHSNHISQEALDTQQILGNSCSRRSITNSLNTLAEQHRGKLEVFLHEAYANEWFLVLIVDDYTTVHTHRRPTKPKSSSSNSMCTIVVKAFKHIKALRLPNKITQLHQEHGIDLSSCQHIVTSSNQMSMLSHTYASMMPGWLTNQFFQPEIVRNRLSTHEYCTNPNVRLMRKMDDLYLVDFVELELKSKQDFTKAMDIVLDTGLKTYMKKFVILQPGDWPCQFFSRKIVYEQLKSTHKCFENPNKIEQQKDKGQPNTRSDQHATEDIFQNDHMYTYNIKTTENRPCTTITDASMSMNKYSPLKSIVPLIGPLHVSLNSREHVMETFHPFFKLIYEKLFPNSKFPMKPKPWRISLLLEIVYGGWTLIRYTTMQVFQNCKDFQYQTFLNLLDNYLPLILSIYAISFKENNFKEYVNAMSRIWVMFTCLKRRHYNKAPLLWLANIHHWGQHFPQLYNILANNIAITDEYPVENAHSIIRAQTRHSDTANQLKKKVKAIFQGKEKQSEFRNKFGHEQKSYFSQNQLKNLKTNCARHLSNILQSIADNPSKSSVQCNNGKKTTKKAVLPDLFGLNVMTETVLPLGFQSNTPPSEEVKCDMPHCPITDEQQQWTILQGCGHSFHDCCIDEHYCPICKQFLDEKIHDLGKAIQDGIFDMTSGQPDGSVRVDLVTDEDTEEDLQPAASEMSDVMFQSVEDINNEIRKLELKTPQTCHKPSQPPPSLAKKPPHCSKCLHPTRGHGRQGAKAYCPTCPQNICSSLNNIKCFCKWHTASEASCPKTSSPEITFSEPVSGDPYQASSKRNSVVSESEHATTPTNKATSPTSAASMSTQKSTSSTQVTVVKKVHRSTTEWLLPKKISQSKILGPWYGSNACTIISVLVAAKLKNKSIPIPLEITGIQNVVNIFTKLMLEGNNIYESFDMDPQEPNLEAKDVIERLPYLGLTIKEDLGCFFEVDLLAKLKQISQQEMGIAILIIPPDKSMLIFKNSGHLLLMDSHEHGLHGGIIATCPSGCVQDFVGYISNMARQVWNVSLQGSNLAILE